MRKEVNVWLHGTVSALITGATTSFLNVLGVAGAQAIGIQVTQLNFRQLAIVTIMGGIVGMAAYLKQSPLPPE